MTHTLIFNSTWPWWLFAMLIVGAIVAVVAIYRYEQREVGGVKGGALTWLRLLLVLMALVMLAQPVLRTRHDIAQQRQVAVLLDDSLSMRIADPQSPPAQRLRWADAVGLLPHDARPVRPERLSTQLHIVSRAAGELGGELTQLQLFRGKQTPPPLALLDSLAGRHEQLSAMVERLKDLARPLSEQGDFRMAMPPAAQAQWQRLSDDLTGRVFVLAGEMLEPLDDADFEEGRLEVLVRIGEKARKLSEAAVQSARLLDVPPEKSPESLAWAIDTAVAGRLDAEALAALDRVSQLTREQFARRLLDHSGGALLDRIRAASGDEDEQFVINVYRFAESAARLPAGQFDAAEQPAAPPAEGKSSVEPRGEPGTDPAAALEQAFSVADSTGVPIAGVVLLSDGNFNGVRDPSAVARERNVSVWPIRIGSPLPPPDLAVLKLETPNSLFKEDTATVTALLKMDGLAGRDVEVRLEQVAGDQQPKVVQTRTVRAEEPSQRRYVEFSFKPDKTGTVNYRVTAAPAGEGDFDDTIADNDQQTFSMIVTEEPTKVLIVDGPPRWEFRYLKNLLQRDRGALVQHVLHDPAYLAGEKQRAGEALRYASVKEAREKGISEVDRLPKTIEELFAFDVIVLGDVGADLLDEPLQKQLERFVAERGGTVIVVAGKKHMPRDFGNAPLAGLLPVTMQTALDAAPPPASVAPFRVRLTDEGQASDILRLSLTPEENQRLWQRIPPTTWRVTQVSAKPGATVLTYAVELKGLGEGPGPTADDVATGPPLSEREMQLEEARSRPLVLMQNYGLGNVMMLAYDRTWQLRYKVGDKYHHRFWAQVMRWATAGRLPVGSDHVKLGTDRARYRPGQRVTVRAKLTREDFTPVTEASLSAELRRDGKLVSRVNLLPASSMPGQGRPTSKPDAGGAISQDGVFVAEVPPLGGGAWTVSLRIDSAEGLPPEDAGQKVAAEFFVEGDDPVEMQELAARSPTELAPDGLVLEPSTAALADQLLGPPVLRQTRYDQTLLWASWWWLLAFVVVAALEWILRKRGGLI